MLTEVRTEPRTRIHEVTSTGSGGSQLLLGATLDSPRPGYEATGWVIPVSGWALGRSSEVVAVEVVAGGDVLKTLPLAIDRPDVTSYYSESALPETCGFHGPVSVLALPPTFELHLRAVFGNGIREPFGTIKGTRSPLNSAHESTLAPLVVTSLGRSGSTFVMDLLRRHPSIVVAGGYPYEFRAARYWLHQLAVVSQPADHVGSAHPDTFHDSLIVVGANPFFDRLDSVPGTWFGGTYPCRLATFVQQCIDELYGEIALSLDKPQASYFAEKHVPDRLQWLAWDLYPHTREIVLVRDFRDMLASILAFNDKRGYVAFGREQCANNVEYVDQLAHDVRRVADAWERRRDIAFLLRYEDLVLSPEKTSRELAQHLGLENGFDLEESKSPELDAHRTTASAKDSIGRWRRDLPTELIERCNVAFAEALNTFGYPDR